MPDTSKSTRTTAPTRARLTPSGAMPEAPHAESSAAEKAPHAATILRHTGTYVADTYTGDAEADAEAMARDGELDGLNRVTRALQPMPEVEPPTPRRLAGLCFWAGAIGILGIVLASWSGVEWMIGTPKWFLAVAAVNGIAGVAMTVGAFFGARKAIVPWALLAGATLTIAFGVLINLYAAQPISVS